jgi:hypothetical protein
MASSSLPFPEAGGSVLVADAGDEADVFSTGSLFGISRAARFEATGGVFADEGSATAFGGASFFATGGAALSVFRPDDSAVGVPVSVTAVGGGADVSCPLWAACSLRHAV